MKRKFNISYNQKETFYRFDNDDLYKYLTDIHRNMLDKINVYIWRDLNYSHFKFTDDLENEIFECESGFELAHMIESLYITSFLTNEGEETLDNLIDGALDVLCEYYYPEYLMLSCNTSKDIYISTLHKQKITSAIYDYIKGVIEGDENIKETLGDDFLEVLDEEFLLLYLEHQPNIFK